MDVTTNDGLEGRLEELISAHIRNLQNDFRRMLDEVVVPDPPDPEPPADLQTTLARLKESVDAILAARTQREMADHLLDAVAAQSSRAALMLVRGEALTGFDTRGFVAPDNDISAFQSEPPASDPLAAALSTTQHVPGSALQGTVLESWHDGTPPAQVCLAPVAVGGRTVAVVYADSGNGEEAGCIRPEAVEILASMAGLFLDRLRHAVRAPAVTPLAPDTATDMETGTESDFEMTDTDRMYGAEPATGGLSTDLQDEPEDRVPDVDLRGDEPTPSASALAFSSGSLPVADPGDDLQTEDNRQIENEAATLEHEHRDKTADPGATHFDPASTVQISMPAGDDQDDLSGDVSTATDASGLGDGPQTAAGVPAMETPYPAGSPETMEFDPLETPDPAADSGMPGIRTPELREPLETEAEPAADALHDGPPSAPSTTLSPTPESGDQALRAGPPGARDAMPSVTSEATAAPGTLVPEEPAPLDLDWTPPPVDLAASPGEPEAFEAPEETLADMAATREPEAPAPAEVTTSDVPANEDAARFARLLVSEIVLYNEAAVKSGRKSGDLYRRLKDSIERSRDAFSERFNADLMALFDGELVRTLAGGDASRMGNAFNQTQT